jgi:hypothetical protein
MLFGMTQGVENGHDIWNLKCKVMFTENSCKRITEVSFGFTGSQVTRQAKGGIKPAVYEYFLWEIRNAYNISVRKPEAKRP